MKFLHFQILLTLSGKVIILLDVYYWAGSRCCWCTGVFLIFCPPVDMHEGPKPNIFMSKCKTCLCPDSVHTLTLCIKTKTDLTWRLSMKLQTETFKLVSLMTGSFSTSCLCLSGWNMFPVSKLLESAFKWLRQTTLQTNFISTSSWVWTVWRQADRKQLNNNNRLKDEHRRTFTPAQVKQRELTPGLFNGTFSVCSMHLYERNRENLYLLYFSLQVDFIIINNLI